MNNPNILWIMTDEQRTDSLGCYGGRLARTPNIDAIAKRGVIFSNAVTPAPVCVPARTTLLTGSYPVDTGVWWNHRPVQRLEYLTQLFAQSGYQTASLGKQHYGAYNPAFAHEEDLVLTDRVDYFSYDSRFASDAFDVVQYPPEPYPWIFGGRFPGTEEDTIECTIVDRAMRWLDERDRDAPFLLRVSFNGPHTPVVVPEPYASLMKGSTLPQDAWATRMADEPRWIRDGLRHFSEAGRLTPDELDRARRFYYAYVAFIDSQCGRLLAYLNGKGLAQDTVIVYTSDHGTHLGDHGLVQKQTFFDPVVNVPFIMACPGRFQTGARIRTPVETRSLLPTLLDLLGVSHGSDAKSLLPYLHTGQEPPAYPVFSEFSLGSFGIMPNDPLIMLRYQNWKLSLCMTAPDGDGTLVDLDADPGEIRNLYDDPRYAATQAKLRSMVEEHFGRSRRL